MDPGTDDLGPVLSMSELQQLKRMLSRRPKSATVPPSKGMDVGEQGDDLGISADSFDNGKDVLTQGDLLSPQSILLNHSPGMDTPSSANLKHKAEDLDPKLIGMSTGFKNLYSGKEDKRGRFQWQDTIPEDVGKPAEDAETQKWALIVRHVKIYNDPRKTLGLHSIVVQSPLLKKLLENALVNYPGVTVGLQRLEFTGKFEPLIHRFSDFRSAIEDLKATIETKDTTADKIANYSSAGDPERAQAYDSNGGPVPVVHEKNASEHSLLAPASSSTKDAGSANSVEDDKAEEASIANDALTLQHAELLHNVLVGEFQTLLDSSLDMKTKSVITFAYLWIIFQPGNLVFSRQDGQERVFRLRSGKYGIDNHDNPVFWTTLQYVDFDGTRFGYKTVNVNISTFTGTRSISSLSVYPLEFHSDQARLRERLIVRSSKIEGFATTAYRAYEGIGWNLNAYGEKVRYSVRGRVIVDALGWNRYNPNYATYVSPLNRKGGYQAAPGMRIRLSDCGSISSRSTLTEYTERLSINEPFDDDDDAGGGMPMDGHFDEDEEASARQPLTEDQKLITTPLLRGYALTEKKWLNLFVNSIREISFNARAFESLVLPENQKELILGFTSTQQSYRNSYDDVIEGKGRGIIILLSGPPGVGKTLTAESVAEEMRVPLFIMSAGDLGIDSREIETRLLSVLGMCTRWNAILLLDEAEVFLEARSTHELERNKIVSIFLRVLEYHEGIMFLTTNRVTTFDPAFHSRIHISLDYPELSVDSRLTVWKNFLKQHNVSQAATRERLPKNSASAVKTDLGEINGLLSEEEQRKQHESRTQPHSITDRQLESLCLMPMNGRQIKNILKTAQLLASRKGESLKHSHISTVLDVTQHLHNETKESERTRNSLFA